MCVWSTQSSNNQFKGKFRLSYDIRPDFILTVRICLDELHFIGALCMGIIGAFPLVYISA